MAPTQTPAGQPPPPAAGQGQGHAVRDAALGAVAVSLLPAAPLAAGALTVTEIAQATTALLTALRRFQNVRGEAFDAELRKEALAEQPTMADVIDNVISRELGFEATFRAKQYQRLQAELGPALAIADPKQRAAKVKALFDRERRYTKMREEAMRVRTMAAIRHHHLEQASPQGAYWILGEGVKNHTPDCLAMANQFWPWSVLHAFSPPVHHGCACDLLSLHEAVAGGLMHPEQVPDEMAAVAHATDVLQRAADALRNGDLKEGDVERYLTVLQESRWEERFAKGTTFAGRFRPKAGGDPGAMLLKRLGLGQRGKVMRDLMPDTRPLSQSERGRWTWIKGRYMRIPHSLPWERQVGGEVFRSPAGTTNVTRDGKLLNAPELEPDRRSAIHDRLDAAVSQARARFARRPGPPLREGDGPEAVLAMQDNGYVPHRVAPHGPGAWKVSYHHAGTGMLASAVVSRTGRVQNADWDTAPIPALRSQKAAHAPRSWGEMAQDAMAWAGELGDRYGARVQVTNVQATHSLEDHAGWHEHVGDTWIGHDAETDIDRAGRARGAGRALTDNEARGVWASYWTMAHEIGHGVNPIHPELHAHDDEANLEDALTEENAHHLAAERLAAQGQDDVLRWRDRHPRHEAVRGVYRRARGGLADVLDRAGVSDQDERRRVVESLKFQVDPAKRFSVLGEMIHRAHPEVSRADGEAFARDKLLRGAKPRSAAGMASPGWHLFGHGKQPEPPKPPPKKDRPPKPPPVVLGGEAPEPKVQPVIPTFHHVPLALQDRAPSWGHRAMKARVAGKDWIVKEHHGDAMHVASELFANGIYRTLGISVPTMGHVETAAAPDFSQVPDMLADEPPLPESGRRISTGVILRARNGKVTLIEPRNHYGGYAHTFPKGGLEEGLTPQQNALKELWEETGLHARITGVVGDFEGDTGSTRYYIGVLTGGEPTPSEETEAVKTVTMKQAAEMLNRPRDQEVLKAVGEMPVPKGKFPDVFPPSVPGSALAFEAPEGKQRTLKAPSASLGEGYMADALIGNREFAGQYGDNLRWTDDMDAPPVRVNHENSFEFKKSWGPKTFGPVPTDVWDMLHRGQGRSISVNEDELRGQAQHIAATLTPEKIAELADAAHFPSAEARDRLVNALASRVDWMRQFGAGEVDLPEPASGAEARAMHADSQRNLTVYPEEEQALGDYAGPAGRELDVALRRDEPPGDNGRKLVKRLDPLLRDSKTEGDSYAWIAHHEDVGDSLVGQTVRQKTFTLAHTDPDAAAAKTRIRLTVPGGSRMFHMADADPGAPDLILPRAARMHISAVRQEGDGSKTVHALLLPYEEPRAPASAGGQMGFHTTGKSYGNKPQGEKPLPSSSYQVGDSVRHRAAPLKGVVTAKGGGKLKVRMKNGKSEWWRSQDVKPLQEGLFGRPLASELLQEADFSDGVMVALHPHPATAKKLALPGGDSADQLHVTLAYLGKQQDLDDPEGLKSTVADWASRTAPLDGEIAGHGVFTAGPEPVSMLLPDLPGLPAARQDLVDSLKDGGQPVSETHGFTPHITLDYKDRRRDMPDHGGRKLKFSKASLVIGGKKHTYKFGGKLDEAEMDAPSQAEREAFYGVHGRSSGVSLKKDDDGFFVHTHRYRSKSYPKPDAIPKSVVSFTESTG